MRRKRGSDRYGQEVRVGDCVRIDGQIGVVLDISSNLFGLDQEFVVDCENHPSSTYSERYRRPVVTTRDVVLE